MHKCKKCSCPSPRTCKCRKVRQATFPIIWLIGGTGSGKMTLGQRCAAHFGMDYISVGQLLRDVVKEKRHEETKTIDQCIVEGRLVDDEIVVDILDRHLRKLYKKSNGFLVTFAKNSTQTDLFEEYIAPVDLILYLECSDDIMMERSKTRATEAGAAANEDDAQNLIEERIKTFNTYIPDVKTKYSKKIQKLDAAKSSEEVFNQAVPIIEQITAKKLAETAATTFGPEDASKKTKSEEDTTAGEAKDGATAN